MPILDVSEQNISLDNDYGVTHGPNSPDSHEVILYIGNPEFDGFEVPDTTDLGAGPVPNGYARGSIDNDASWSPAVDGQKSTAAPVVFPDALAAYPGTVTHAGLRNPDTGGIADVVPLLAPLDVTDAGPPPEVSLTVFYSDSITEE